MLRTLGRTLRSREDGQALVLFALGLIVFLGCVAMSIDVGRLVWARTQMQAAVDAAALAAAQSMPSVTDAEDRANAYWLDNSGFIRSQGTNVQFSVSYPPTGNKRVSIHGQADIPTWFARILGIDHWTVSANGDAEAQILDIAVVLDVSSSMCYDSFDQVGGGMLMMSPGRLTPAGGFAFPRLAASIPAGGGSPITISLNDIRIFNSTNAATNRSNFGISYNSTQTYWNADGTIEIDKEVFKITGVNAAANTLTVKRAQAGSAQAAHAVNAEVWANRTGYSNTIDFCELASYHAPTTSTNGPHQPFDDAISDAQYFTTLFNSSYDKIGLAKFSSTAATLQGLTSNFATVRSAMDGVLWPSGYTNTAYGIGMGRQVLKGSGSRSNAVRVLVILTDGAPNRTCSNGYNGPSCSEVSGSTPSSCPVSGNTPVTDAINQAAAAKTDNITVYTIGLGDGVLDCVLQSIATAGGGLYYKAPTTADLAAAFKAIADRTKIALVK